MAATPSYNRRFTLNVPTGARQAVGPGSVPPFVAPARQLAPQHAPGQVVSTPSALPANIRFGGTPPGFAHSSRYTGGTVVPQAGAGQTFAPPDFVAPTYQTPTLSAPTAAPPSRLGFVLGPPPVSPPPTNHTPTNPPGLGVHIAGGDTQTQRQPHPYGGAVTGPPGTPVSTAPNGSINSFTPGTTVSPSGQSLSYLLAVAAQRGTRIPGSGAYQF